MGTTKTQAELERQSARPEPEPNRIGRDHRRAVPVWLAAVLGLFAGLGVAVVATKLLSDDSGSSAPATVPRTLAAEVKSPAEVLPDANVPAGAGAASADAAIMGFLGAEVHRDYAASFGFLSDADRQSFGSPAGWVAAHASTMAPILDFTVAGAEARDTTATVAGQLTLEPGLDQVIGLIPERANVTWQVTRGLDGSWGVSLDASTIEPVYAGDDGAAPAAQRWLADRQACRTASNERAGLIGSPELADALCGAGNASVVGGPMPLNAAQTAAVGTAYGAEAASAARIVRVSGPVELGVVLVPIGSSWTVIGVLE